MTRILMLGVMIFSLGITGLLKLLPIPVAKASLNELCLEGVAPMGKDVKAIVCKYHLDVPPSAAKV